MDGEISNEDLARQNAEGVYTIQEQQAKIERRLARIEEKTDEILKELKNKK